MATQTTNDVKTNEWYIGQPQKNSHGGTFFPIYATKDAKIAPRVQIGDASSKVRCPFGVTQFGDTGGSGRMSLDMSVSDVKIQQFLQKIDKFILENVWNRRTEFFGKKAPVTFELLKENYVPLLNPKQDFDPLFKTKINSSSLMVFKVQDGRLTDKRNEPDEVTSGSEVVPVCSFTKLWIMGQRFGCTALTNAVMLWQSTPKAAEDIFRNMHLIDATPLLPVPAG